MLFAVCAFAIVLGSTLYIPSGYFVLESVDMGPLCFGIRKSFFLHSSKNVYMKAKALMVADGRDVKKMDEILGCFSEGGEPEARTA